MRDGVGQDVASGPLLLRPVRQHLRRGRLPREGRKALLPQRLLQHVRPQVRRLQRPHHGQLHISSQRPVAPRMLRLQGLPTTLQRGIVLRPRGSSLLRDPLPCQKRIALCRLSQAHYRSLHHCYVPQVPSGTLCLLVLPEATEQGHLQGAERQALLPWMLRQTLRLSYLRDTESRLEVKVQHSEWCVQTRRDLRICLQFYGFILRRNVLRKLWKSIWCVWRKRKRKGSILQPVIVTVPCMIGSMFMSASVQQTVIAVGRYRPYYPSFVAKGFAELSTHASFGNFIVPHCSYQYKRRTVREFPTTVYIGFIVSYCIVIKFALVYVHCKYEEWTPSEFLWYLLCEIMSFRINPQSKISRGFDIFCHSLLYYFVVLFTKILLNFSEFFVLKSIIRLHSRLSVQYNCTTHFIYA